MSIDKKLRKLFNKKLFKFNKKIKKKTNHLLFCKKIKNPLNLIKK